MGTNIFAKTYGLAFEGGDAFRDAVLVRALQVVDLVRVSSYPLVDADREVLPDSKIPNGVG